MDGVEYNDPEEEMDRAEERPGHETGSAPLRETAFEESAGNDAEESAARLTGFFAWLIWLAVHIYFLVGFRNRLVAIFQWAWTYFTFDRGARLITFENDRDP